MSTSATDCAISFSESVVVSEQPEKQQIIIADAKITANIFFFIERLRWIVSFFNAITIL